MITLSTFNTIKNYILFAVLSMMSDMHKRHILITNHLGTCIYNNLFQ